MLPHWSYPLLCIEGGVNHVHWLTFEYEGKIFWPKLTAVKFLKKLTQLPFYLFNFEDIVELIDVKFKV